MPTVSIHKVTKTIENAINYGKADKKERVEEVTQKDDIADTIRYAESDKHAEIVYPTLTNFVNTNGEDFTNECKELLKQFPRKRNVRENENPALLFHLIQSFEGYVPPQLANQIGQEFASEFLKDYICQVSTHTNTDNIHNHIIFCAVNLNGERYNDCDDTMNQMRKVSDRISDKYGLRILEDTKDYKPIHWKDKNGNRHSFEPTKRKNDLLKMKQNGRLISSDISSYQNTKGFELENIKKATLKETVKRDIDSALPLAKNFDDLISILRMQYGYKINDKKKNGDYLSHITYTPPTHSKGVRDYKIDDDGFYKRENLEKYISENYTQITYDDIQEQEHSTESEDIPVFEKYDYERIDISRISLERRAWRSSNSDKVEYVKRGEPEKALISDAQSIENALFKQFSSFGFEKWQADYIFHHLNENGLSERFSVNSEQIKVAVERVNDIQERLNALHFVEDNNLFDFKNVGSVMKAYWDRYNSSFEKLNEVGNKLEKLRFIIQLPTNIEKIKKRIDSNKTNSQYMEYEYSNDVALLEKYTNYYKTNGLDSKEKISTLSNDYKKWENTYLNLSTNLDEQKNKLLSFERSVYILRCSSIGKQAELKDTWLNYDAMCKNEKSTERSNEEVRRNRHKKSDRSR